MFLIGQNTASTIVYNDDMQLSSDLTLFPYTTLFR